MGLKVLKALRLNVNLLINITFIPRFLKQNAIVLLLLHWLSHGTGELSLHLSPKHQFFRREWRKRGHGGSHCAWHQPACGGKVFR